MKRMDMQHTRRAAVARLTLGLGAALAAPMPLAAQNLRSAPRIGFLMNTAPPPAGPSIAEDMVLELRRLGHTGLVAEIRYGEGRIERLPALAQELVRLGVDVIVASQTPAALAARDATQKIPIVLASAADPVAVGLAQSLSRPGGNVTGVSSMSTEVAAKNLELLRALKPSARRVGALLNERDPFWKPLEHSLSRAATRLGMELRVAKVADVTGIESTFAGWDRSGVDAVFVQASLPYAGAIELARQRRLPTMSFVRQFAVAGGLMAYAPHAADTVRMGASYVDRLLRGAKAAELPIQQPTVFALVVNRKTAASLGLALPPQFELQVTDFVD